MVALLPSYNFEKKMGMPRHSKNKTKMVALATSLKKDLNAVTQRNQENVSFCCRECYLKYKPLYLIPDKGSIHNKKGSEAFGLSVSVSG